MEVGMPVWQHYDGPTLDTELIVILGWQVSI